MSAQCNNTFRNCTCGLIVWHPPLSLFVFELWEFLEVHHAKLCVKLMFPFGFSTCTGALLHRVTPAKAVPMSKCVGFLIRWDVNARANDWDVSNV